MNTLKTIYDKLGDKTELAKHEVELKVIDDIKTYVVKINSLSNLVNALAKDAGKNQTKLSEALDEKKRLITEQKKYESAFKEYSKQFTLLDNKLAAQVKELGININDLPIAREFSFVKDNLGIIGSRIETLIPLITRY